MGRNKKFNEEIEEDNCISPTTEEFSAKNEIHDDISNNKKQKIKDKFNLEDCQYKSGYISGVLFFWITPIINKGKLSLKYMGDVSKDESSKHLHSSFDQVWENEIEKGPYSLIICLIKLFKFKFLCAITFNLLSVTLEASIPFLLKEVIKYIEDTQQSINFNHALFYIILTLLIMLISRILRENMYFYRTRLCSQANHVLISMVYSKILKISSSSKATLKKGDIINLIQVDAEKVNFLFEIFPKMLGTLLQLIYCIISLYLFVGVTLVVAIVIIGLFGVLNFFIAKLTAIIQKKRLKKLDNTLNKITEIIDNIKLIKINCWTEMFLEKAIKLKSKEILINASKLILQVFASTITNLDYPLLMVSILLTAIYGMNLSITVPAALAILQILKSFNKKTSELPEFIGECVEFLVSIKRIQKFLLSKEVEFCSYVNSGIQSAIKIDHLSFYWKFDEIKLKRISKIDRKRQKRILREQSTQPIKSESRLNCLPKSSHSIPNNENIETHDLDRKLSSEEESKDSPLEENESNPEFKIRMEDKFTLKDISIDIPTGSFVVIIGDIGSGKSSLISAIINDMLPVNQEIYEKYRDLEIFNHELVNNVEIKERMAELNNRKYQLLQNERLKDSSSNEDSKSENDFKPQVHIRGSICLMEQSPWILNTSIRNNILFGEDLDNDKYNRIIEICQLANDLETLEGGDLTEIGEKGINLSGGQKSRIGIARALYSNRDIILMDDPLSALDVLVKKQIFEKVILGELKGKTRVLITHSGDFIDQADKIIVLNKGRISHQGSFEELKDYDYFKKIIKNMKSRLANEDEEVKNSDTDINEESKNFVCSKVHKLTVNENKEKVSSGFKPYLNYLTYTKSTSICAMLAVLFIILSKAFNISFDYYLLTWIKEVSSSSQNNVELFYKVLRITGVIALTSILLGFFELGFALSISSRLFKDMITRVVNAPVNLYFDVTPSGIIMNKFSKDIVVTESRLPTDVFGIIKKIMTTASVVVIAIYTTPLFAFIIPALILFGWDVFTKFSYSIKEISRLENISLSPIITHLSETINGKSTIRAYQKGNQFLEKQYALQDKNIACNVIKRGIKGWFYTKVTLISLTLMLFVFLFCALSKGRSDPVILTLLIVYLIDIQIVFLKAFRQQATVDSKLINFERCISLCNIVQEPTLHLPIPKNSNNESWISHGKVEFINYSARYRPDTKLVLEDINFEIQPGEKVGIVGRTGAGKSSILMALCRMIETCSGKILIDGVDISNVGIMDLWEQIAVIPQDPALLENTLRFNLDPHSKSTDKEIMNLLIKAGCENLVLNSLEGLDTPIHSKCSNFSSGEKQLICILRSILTSKHKILIMDEATSQIDLKTERMLTSLLHEHFANSTVITIAHRFKTVAKCSKILVLCASKLSVLSSDLSETAFAYFCK